MGLRDLRDSLFVLLVVCSLTACSQSTTAHTTVPSIVPSITPLILDRTESAVPVPATVIQKTLTPTQFLSTPTPTPSICSPLDGYSLEELPSLISNPYNPPGPGSDDPHQGVDLADRLPGSQAAISGMGVRTLMSGVVAGIIEDRFPYGYAVLVETRLQDMDLNRLPSDYLPEPLPEPLVNPALTCPPVQFPVETSFERSIYVLYAHLKSQPLVARGQDVSCGQNIGYVGQSGNALNPHLHVESRLGPAGAIFLSLAHYDNSATQVEMGLYCLWRVSGMFQLLDPMVLLSTQP